MNAQEVGEVAAIVRALYPAQRFDDDPQNVLRAWALVLGDLQLPECRDAVARLARRGQQWCSPGDVRREVARMRHLLSPDVDSLLADVRLVAAKGGVGRRVLHPAARHVYDAIGGCEAIRRLDVHGLARVRRQLEDAVKVYDEHQLQAPELPESRQPYAQLTDRTLLEAPSVSDRASERVAMPPALREQFETFGKLPS